MAFEDLDAFEYLLCIKQNLNMLMDGNLVNFENEIKIENHSQP